MVPSYFDINMTKQEGFDDVIRSRKKYHIYMYIYNHHVCDSIVWTVS